MWLYLVTTVGLYYLLDWYRERQVVSHLQDKYVFITGCDSGFGNLLAMQLDLRGMRVLAACLTEKGAEQLRGLTSDRLETVILDVNKTESITAATQGVKEHVGDGVSSTWYELQHFLQHFGVKVSIIEAGFFRNGIVDAQAFSKTIKQVWDEVPMHIKETYGQKLFDEYCNNIQREMSSCSTNLNLVVGCLEHALTSVYPRTRYSAGLQAQFYFIPLSYLPMSLRLYIDQFLAQTSPGGLKKTSLAALEVKKMEV